MSIQKIRVNKIRGNRTQRPLHSTELSKRVYLSVKGISRATLEIKFNYMHKTQTTFL